MTRKLRTVLVAVMLLSLIAGGFGSAAAGPCDDDPGVDDSVVNDDDVVDVDDTLNGNLNGNNINVLGLATQDSNSQNSVDDEGGLLG